MGYRSLFTWYNLLFIRYKSFSMSYMLSRLDIDQECSSTCATPTPSHLHKVRAHTYEQGIPSNT